MWVYTIKFENGQVHEVKRRRPNIEDIKINNCPFELYLRFDHCIRCHELIAGPAHDRKYLTCDKPLLEYFGGKVLSKRQVDGREPEVQRLDWYNVEMAIENCYAFRPSIK